MSKFVVRAWSRDIKGKLRRELDEVFDSEHEAEQLFKDVVADPDYSGMVKIAWGHISWSYDRFAREDQEFTDFIEELRDGEIEKRRKALETVSA